jgi:PAS domain S-box-containing protein
MSSIHLKNRIKLISALVILTASLFGVFTFSLFQKNRQAYDKASVANQIVLKVFERNFLGNDYSLTRSERAKVQWLAKQTELEALVESHGATLKAPEEKEFITRVRSALSDSREAFQDTVSLNETKSTTADTKTFEEKFIRLSSRRAVKSQETISAAAGLKELNDKRAADTARQIVLLFGATGGLFAVVLLGGLIEIWRTANQLEKQKAQSEAILRDIGDAVFALDTEGKIVLFNKIASKITGYKELEVLGRPYSDVLKFVDEKTKASKDNFIERALRGKKSHMYTGTDVRTKSGRYIPVADSAAPIFNFGDTIEGVVVVFRDVTPERELEQAKDEFFSTASHQLRTPLGSLRWNIELLLGDTKKLSKATVQRLLEMRSSTTRALSLIDDLLSLIRIQQGRVENSPVPTDLVEIATLAVQEIRPIALEKKVSVKLDVKKSPKSAMIDPKRFREVIQNLVSNAVKYTPAKGKVVITVNTDTKQTVISVSDTGIGIPKTDQRHIFSKFFRARNVTATNAEGTGLGLFIARAYAKEWGGRLWFTSNPGKGTTFYLSVPKTPKQKRAKPQTRNR